jgi:hypothetical protein
VALLVPIIAGLIGLFNSFRMMRLPEIEPRASIEEARSRTVISEVERGRTCAADAINVCRATKMWRIGDM